MPVYRDMDQQTLEREYNARASVSDFDAEMRRYRALSNQAYARCRVIRDLPYGDHPDERFDLFPAGDGAPVLVFLHGGYWRFLGRSDSAFMAQTMVNAGIAVAVVEYTLAPAATLDQIVDQVRRALASIHQQSTALGINPDRIYVCGSSAGAHLAAMALLTDWQAQSGLPSNLIKGAVLVSGLFDLEPVRLCQPNSWLNLSPEAAARNSPIGQTLPVACPVMIFWGAEETREFKRQSADFAQALQTQGLSVSATEIAGRNHFDVIVDLADSDRMLCRETVTLLRSD